jgi:hypothetical protein
MSTRYSTRPYLGAIRTGASLVFEHPLSEKIKKKSKRKPALKQARQKDAATALNGPDSPGGGYSAK